MGLRLGGEISQAGEFLAQLLECQILGTQAARLNLLDHQLIVAARRVNADPATDQDLHPFSQILLELLGRAAPEHAADEGIRILEAQVNVPGAGTRERRNLAHHPDRGEVVFHQRLDLGGEMADRPDLGFIEEGFHGLVNWVARPEYSKGVV